MKKSEKGFTLIELLVVVAIIGILAAVGVVAYSGYTEGAKKSGAKSNHANVVKYIAAEMKKCNIGTDSGKAMKDPSGTDQLTCSDVGSAGKVATAAIAALGDFKNTHGEVSGSKLAVIAGAATAQTCSNSNKGQVLVMDDGNSLYVYTCATDDGTTANGNLLKNQMTVE
jgi:type IV pilus assembly protein PilA|tara:strand:+ start:353 stop:859 length:507 start_codon:yes stop_codon:yes gene_type:complete